MEIINRKAQHDYFVEETYEAGIVLTGTEIKSIRNGKPEWFKHFCLEGINNGYRAAINKFFESKHSHMVFGEGIYWDQGVCTNDKDQKRRPWTSSRKNL